MSSALVPASLGPKGPLEPLRKHKRGISAHARIHRSDLMHLKCLWMSPSYLTVGTAAEDLRD